MQARCLIRVEFGEHIDRERVDGMLGTLMACGDMTHGPNDRTFLVEVRRPKSLAHLKETLLGWEKWGFIKWSEMPNDPEVA
jgi:hypothetical protein